MEEIKLMIVDDEELNADGIEEIITQEQIPHLKIVTFYSSLQAVEYLMNNKIDILLTDINMPQLSGLELINRVHSLQPNMRIIILTGYGSLEYATEAMKYGVRYFLKKPYMPQQLLNDLNEVIKERRYLDQLILMELKHVVESSFYEEDVNNLGKNEFSFFIYCNEFHKMIGNVLEKELKKREIGFLIGEIEKCTIFYYMSSHSVVDLLKNTLASCQGNELVICYSEHSRIEEAKIKIDQAMYYLNWSFYHQRKKILCVDEQPEIKQTTAEDIETLFSRVKKCINKEEYYESKELLTRIFTEASGTIFSPSRLKKELLSIFFSIFITQGKCFEEISKFESHLLALKTSRLLKKCVVEVIDELEEANLVIKKSNSITENMNLIVEKYYSDSQLTLKWIAENVLFMNAEHLGRVYQKERNEKFSAHLMDFRLDKAKKLLAEGRKVYEVAELTGFRDNPEYFNKVFKKNIGLTPLKYSKAHSK
ncbi:response regulator [Enterococcus faecium]|nr:response regulator [Enterococcus faecium]EKG9127384.1 response regulator [Enterococcus faecium]